VIRVPRLLLVLVALVIASGLVLGGYSLAGGGEEEGGESTTLGAAPEARDGAAAPAIPSVATKNTTRVGVADPPGLAASVARAVYPGRSADSRPPAVALADARDWRAAISAAQLMAPPVRAPLLLSDGDRLPAATEAALRALRPRGAKPVGDAQVVRIGAVAQPAGLASTDVAAGGAAPIARAIDQLVAAAAGRPSATVLVAPADAPAYAMPAAAWAAKSGDPVLWTSRNRLPAATRTAIVSHRRPRIYVLGPPSAVSNAVVSQLERLGTVQRVTGEDPIAGAIAFARFSDGRFGWNVVDPGHGLVFAAGAEPVVAAAAAALSSSGTYGPLLLLERDGALPARLQDYLLDIQPGFERDPVRGVYNHGWLMGDERAISLDVQARIDTLLEIQPVDDARG
jgi:hypothetical protein